MWTLLNSQRRGNTEQSSNPRIIVDSASSIAQDDDDERFLAPGEVVERSVDSVDQESLRAEQTRRSEEASIPRIMIDSAESFAQNDDLSPSSTSSGSGPLGSVGYSSVRAGAASSRLEEASVSSMSLEEPSNSLNIDIRPSMLSTSPQAPPSPRHGAARLAYASTEAPSNISNNNIRPPIAATSSQAPPSPRPGAARLAVPGIGASLPPGSTPTPSQTAQQPLSVDLIEHYLRQNSSTNTHFRSAFPTREELWESLIEAHDQNPSDEFVDDLDVALDHLDNAILLDDSRNYERAFTAYELAAETLLEFPSEEYMERALPALRAFRERLEELNVALDDCWGEIDAVSLIFPAPGEVWCGVC